jgi:hypothetical protein
VAAGTDISAVAPLAVWIANGPGVFELGVTMTALPDCATFAETASPETVALSGTMPYIVGAAPDTGLSMIQRPRCSSSVFDPHALYPEFVSMHVWELPGMSQRRWFPTEPAARPSEGLTPPAAEPRSDAKLVGSGVDEVEVKKWKDEATSLGTVSATRAVLCVVGVIALGRLLPSATPTTRAIPTAAPEATTATHTRTVRLLSRFMISSSRSSRPKPTSRWN